MAARTKTEEENKVKLKTVQAVKQMLFEHPVRQVDLRSFKHSWSVPKYLHQFFALLWDASLENLYKMLKQ